nr:hypothetical protein [Tanacetum cinerariifolium]
MVNLAFCDYHNMVAILEKTEHNTNFHQIVDFLEASHIRYALTISPTIYVSHIRQFWSTARIETTDKETKIIATVDGKPRTICESSLRRNLKLNDEEGISSLPDVELFENLSLTGYNILPNQSNIATAVVCLATNGVYNFSKMIFDGMGEGSANLTEPHHTPSPQEYHSPQHDSPPLSHQAPTETLTPRRFTRRAIRIAQSKAFPPTADEPASLSRDDRQGEAFPTVSSLDVGLMEAANILSNGGAAASVSLADVLPTAGVPTASGSFPTVSVIFTTASMVTPYTRRSRAREMKEEFAKENQRLSKQVTRDYEIARIHAEEELKMMIEGLDRSNEVIAKHLSKYEQAKADLSVGEKIELISELVKYQDHHTKILKYQAQQSKPLSKKDQMEFYMSVLRSHAGWKTKHFRGMT